MRPPPPCAADAVDAEVILSGMSLSLLSSLSLLAALSLPLSLRLQLLRRAPPLLRRSAADAVAASPPTPSLAASPSLWPRALPLTVDR